MSNVKHAKHTAEAVQAVEVVPDDELIDVAGLTQSLVEDQDLSDDDVEVILEAARKRQAQKTMTLAEIDHIMNIAKGGTRTATFDKIPLPAKIYSILLIISGVLSMLSVVILGLALAGTGFVGELAKEYTTSTMAVTAIALVAYLVSGVLGFTIGVRVMKRKRAKAGALIWAAVAFNVIGVVCDIMLSGADPSILSDLVAIGIKIAFSIYLNPAMAREDKLRKGLRDLDLEKHASEGTLGLADKGKGFIRLDFFNVFWTFVVCCVIGLIVEIIWHMVVVEPGVYQDRAGLLFGPFSPIYGIGAVLMTVALNRFKDKNIILIFVVCTIIGGAFEYCTSWFMEIGFGAKAWDYSEQWLGWVFGGRTCPLFASMFGVLGLVWIKLLLPILLKLINKIPWNWRVGVTTVAAAFMLVNGIMTLQALDNWYARCSGHVPASPVEQFYADNFGDDFMKNRFQSMTITPENSARG